MNEISTRNEPIVDRSITLKSGRKLAYCEHGVDHGEPVIFFCGAGFGRRYVPTPFPSSSLLFVEKNAVRFITIDRPGYGDSDPHPGRTYPDWVRDVGELMDDHLNLKKARFLAHSAGTPHLAAVCALSPHRVIAASFVCPVSPIVGTPPIDRPSENFTRGCGRFCLLYLGGVLDTLFGAVFRKWQADPQSYVQDTMKQIVSGKKDLAFMKEHSDFFQGEYADNFGHAVHEPNGVSAMLEDMFHVNKVSWGFRYSDIGAAKKFPVQVWWGDADDTAPHGKWICEQLQVEGNCAEGAGHGLIHNEFGTILSTLLRAQSSY